MPVSTGPGNTVSTSLSPRSAALLSHLESARDRIARRLVQDYPLIADPDLNYAIITSLLQVLFLKAGQECGLVEPGTLTALAGCDGITKRMGRACSDAGLSPEIFVEQGSAGSRMLWALSDEPLREMIHRLEMQDVPVPLSPFSVEELAAVLDHFLGTRMQTAEGYRVIRVGKSVLLYTGTVDVPPQTIVEYVVSKTINGSTGSTPTNDLSSGRILDPACGAGLFLLAAYRYLVRKKTRHLNLPEDVGEVLQDLACRSLLGTDIDPDSVSAARFVLVSAFIDERKQMGFAVSPGQIREVCIGVTKTIRCGNALIAPDYFSGKPTFPFNADERRNVNPFDWQEAFPEILAEGGFDAVIGAPPPYRPFSVKAREEYFQTHYDVYAVSAGLYGYFIERGLGLLRSGGTLTVLVPGTFLRFQYARPLRRLLLSRQIELIACTGRTRVLPGGEAMMYILTLRNQLPEHRFIVSPALNFTGARKETPSGRNDFTLDQRALGDGGWNLDDTRTADLIDKLRKRGTRLDHYVMGEIDHGVHRIRNNPLVVDPETRDRLTKDTVWCRRFLIPLLRPAEIRRYVPVKPARFVISATNLKNLRKCRALSRFLEQAAHVISTDPGPEPAKENTGVPGESLRVTPLKEQRVPKIIFSPYQHSPSFCFDPKGNYAIASTLVAIPRNDPYLAAILNSSLGRFIIIHTSPFTDRGYTIGPAVLGKFPVMIPDFDKIAEKTRHDKIGAIVSRMLSLHEYLPRAGTDQERRLVQQEIDATDVRIDALVYEVYGLTPEEISIVEESAAK